LRIIQTRPTIITNKHNGINTYKIEYGNFSEISISFFRNLRNIISDNRKQIRAKIPKTLSEATEMLKGYNTTISKMNERRTAIPRYAAHQ